MASFEVVSIPEPGLGNSSHLIDLGDGSALVIDPARDPRPYLQVARTRRLQIRYVAETHLHADFVSGGRELVAQGAHLLAPRASQLAHEYRALEPADEVMVGDLTLQAVASPGHTPEHLAYLIFDGPAPLVLFSGGTLMVGGVARPDLVAPELTIPLAREAYRSVRKLLTSLPDEVEVRPTHGGGSFCSSAGAPPALTSNIGRERAGHPVMRAADEESFVASLLAGLGTHPKYFNRLREVNQRGPRVYGEELPQLTPLSRSDLGDMTVIDVRSPERFASGHISGSISIALRDQFATWLGWLIEPSEHLAFVMDPEQSERELVRQALNVGFENLAGRISIDDWTATGGPLEALPLIPPEGIAPDALLLDVRQRSEWERGHLPSALHVELGELSSSSSLEPGMVVHCEHGPRAMTAASLLARTGNKPAAVTSGSYEEIGRLRPST